MKVEQRDLARKLRSEEGLSVRLIAERLGVSKGSVSRWVRDIELSPAQHAALRRTNYRYNGQLLGQQRRSASARAARLAAQEHGREYARRNDRLHVLGCLLYWAEGSKSRTRLTFTNSDLQMIRVFLRFLRQCYEIPDERIALTVNCHVTNGLTAGAIVAWWLRELGLPDGCARKPMINRVPSSSRQRRGHILPYGTARLDVHSVFVIQSIYGAIQEYAGFERPAWLD